MKKAIQIGELLYPERFRERLAAVCEWTLQKAERFYGRTGEFTFEEMLAWSEAAAETVAPLICDTSVLLEEGARAGKKILFERSWHPARPELASTPTPRRRTLAAYAPHAGSAGRRTAVAVVKAFSTRARAFTLREGPGGPAARVGQGVRQATGRP